MTAALAFLSGPEPLDYGSRLSRLAWRRAARATLVREWRPEGLAGPAIAEAPFWVVVADPAALPVVEGAVRHPPAGRVLWAESAVPIDPPFVHTVRELEAARLGPTTAGPAGVAALAFRAADFPAADHITIKQYVGRLLNPEARCDDSAFRTLSFEDPSERERSELVRRLPADRLRVLDAGCGAGAGIAGGRAAHPGWKVTGIERDAGLAARARARCDRLLEGDLLEILPALERDGERFDAIVFADVLEHLEDPVAALVAARRIAAPGAMLLASVPNVGHLSIVRDLLAGRFDPTPTGLLDARHLRWFTRTFIGEVIAEAGWRVETIEGEGGAPAAGADAFLALAGTWPDCDRESLSTYQWVATAVNRER